MKKIIFTIFLFYSLSLFSQDKSYKEIIKEYKKELKLNKSQELSFNKIVLKCNKELTKYNKVLTKEEKRAFNKIVKTQDYSIYQILDEKQFKMYKKLRSEIEKSKKYKF